ncbi:MAG: CSLREA domain-containing protein [Candidatus Competibacteraceae bacterium]
MLRAHDTTAHSAIPPLRRRRLSLALLLALGGTAQAATITVNSNADEAISDPDNGNCTLREAVEAANTNTAVDACTAGEAGPVIDTIEFNDGLGTIALTEGQLSISETLSITGPAGGVTIDAGARRGFSTPVLPT